jgi:hypothetical protein
MPITVIKNRFLYRRRFRQETFTEKLKCRHRKGIRSKRIRFPALGALGRMRVAGVSLAVESTANRVAPTVHRRPADTAPTLRGQ